MPGGSGKTCRPAVSCKTDKVPLKTDKKSLKTDKASLKTDKVSLKTDRVYFCLFLTRANQVRRTWALAFSL
jgi:hypothetical protein